MSATRARRTLGVRLSAIAEQLAPDELAVLALIAERLLQGRQRYGALHVATDRRDFAREALEEAADGLVYTAAALLRSAQHPTADTSSRPRRDG